MPKNIIVYFVALFLIIGSIFFLSSYFLDLQSKDTVKKNSELIFEAKNISIKLNFKESDLLLKISSSMINSKKSEKNLYVFKPEISITGEDKFFEIKSNRGIILYDKNLIELDDNVLVNGSFFGKKVFGETKKLGIDLNRKNLYSEKISLYLDDFRFLFNEIVLKEKEILLKGNPIKLFQEGVMTSQTSVIKINLDGKLSFPEKLNVKMSE